jgi:CubicO group peptidase (beta-lactamase class C family)
MSTVDSIKHLAFFIGVVLFLAGSVACSTRPVTTEIGDSIALAAKPNLLDEYFSQRFSPNEPGGAVLIMANDSVILSKGYGISDIRSKEKVTTQTLFNLGSVSKTFVANAILMLRDQGKLSLDDNLSKYFPEFNDKTIANKVMIKHLLTHASGLPDIRYPWKDSVFYLSARDAENWTPIMKATKLNFEPGSHFEYSNPTFNALALIVEQVSKQKWQSYVTEKIMLPSGMKTSTITDGPHPQSGVAHGYIRLNGVWMEKDYGEEPTFAAAGNGGVWSSVEELAMYAKALNKATFLKAETIDESFQIKKFTNWADTTPEKIGWSWFIGKTKEGYKTIGHTGNQGGFRANYALVPEKGWLIIMLSSSPHPLEEYTERVFQYLRTGQ